MDGAEEQGIALKVKGARSLEQGQESLYQKGSTGGHMSCAQLYYSAPVIFGDPVPGPPSSWKGVTVVK